VQTTITVCTKRKEVLGRNDRADTCCFIGLRISLTEQPSYDTTKIMMHCLKSLKIAATKTSHFSTKYYNITITEMRISIATCPTGPLSALRSSNALWPFFFFFSFLFFKEGNVRFKGIQNTLITDRDGGRDREESIAVMRFLLLFFVCLFCLLSLGCLLTL